MGPRLCLWPIPVLGSGAVSPCAQYRVPKSGASSIPPPTEFVEVRGGGESAITSDQSHTTRSGTEGAESGVRTSDWLGEIVLSTNEEVRQDGGERPGSSRACGQTQTVEVRGAEKRQPRAMAAVAAVAAAAAMRARILQASEVGAKGSRN